MNSLEASPPPKEMDTTLVFAYGCLLLTLFALSYLYNWIYNYDAKFNTEIENALAFRNLTQETLNRFFLELEQAKEDVRGLQGESQDYETQSNRYQAWKLTSQSDLATLELFIIRQKLGTYADNRSWVESSEETLNYKNSLVARDFYTSQVSDWEPDAWLGGTAILKETLINGWGSSILCKGLLVAGSHAPVQSTSEDFRQLFQRILNENQVSWARILVDTDLNEVRPS